MAARNGIGSTLLDVSDEPDLPEESNVDPPEEHRRRVLWWPEKWAVPTGPNLGGEPLAGNRYAWWQWRKRRRVRSYEDVAHLTGFDWRSIRISFRRSPGHRRNDPPTR
jgi:hypothetical protein